MSKHYQSLLLIIDFFQVNGHRERIYEGQWLDSKQYRIEIFREPNREKYEGEWKDNMKHRNEIFYLPNGEQYQGQWSNNNMNGQGTYYSDGSIYNGD